MAYPDVTGAEVKAIHALCWGQVTNNEDPEQRGRVKVCIPGLVEPETDWAMVVMPGQGEPDRGLFTPLPRNAVCLVGFVLGDVDEPVVVGGVTAPDPTRKGPYAGLTPAQTANVMTMAMGRYSITLNSNTDHPALYIRDEGNPTDPCSIVLDGNNRAITINGQVSVHSTSAAGVAIDGLKSNLKYSYAMGIDNPDAVANSVSHYIYLTGDPESLNRAYALYDKVTIEDVKMVADKYYVDSGLTIATISSVEKGGVE